MQKRAPLILPFRGARMRERYRPTKERAAPHGREYPVNTSLPNTAIRSNSLYSIFLMRHNQSVPWEVEYTAEFGTWWDQLAEAEQVKVDAMIRLLEEFGPDLAFPMSSAVKGS
jgi:hypothetical protein